MHVWCNQSVHSGRRWWGSRQATIPFIEQVFLRSSNFLILSTALQCSNSQAVQGPHPVPSVLHLGLSVSNCSKPFNNGQTRPYLGVILVISWGYLVDILRISLGYLGDILGITWGYLGISWGYLVCNWGVSDGFCISSSIHMHGLRTEGAKKNVQKATARPSSPLQ